MIFKATAFLLLFSLSLFGRQIPEAIVPAGVGVNIHFVKGGEQDLDLIQAAGFKWVRMDFTWGGTEGKKGVYDFSSYDELNANLEKRGLSVIYILDYGNSLYEGAVGSPNPITKVMEKQTASPQHPHSVDAFARWAAAAAKHFRGKRICWEIWNEPNIFFWKPQPDAEQYSALALSTAKAIRRADQNATIMGPATSGIPMDFLETLFKSGVLQYFDAVSVHPYRTDFPESAGADYVKLRQLIDRYAPAKKHLPILSGEWGYSSAKGQFSLKTQADYAVRQQLFNLLKGIPISIWYDWKNDGPDAGESEQNFGAVTDELQPKPAFIALQTMMKELAGYHFDRRPKTDNGDFVLVFKNKERSKLAYWTVGESHIVSVETKDLALTGSPQYAAWQ
jgi:hypothetical protein